MLRLGFNTQGWRFSFTPSFTCQLCYSPSKALKLRSTNVPSTKERSYSTRKTCTNRRQIGRSRRVANASWIDVLVGFADSSASRQFRRSASLVEAEGADEPSSSCGRRSM